MTMIKQSEFKSKPIVKKTSITIADFVQKRKDLKGQDKKKYISL
jgi:hypothetical protein